MNRLIATLFLITLLITLSGCKHESPTDTVCLLDISKSITVDGVQFEFRAVDALVDHMQRGDRLTLIPITGNAMSETPGHVLHFAVPTERAPYDHDLAIFRQQAHEKIRAMQDAATAHPGDHTDILGALDIAHDEFTGAQDKYVTSPKQTLIIFSDFIEDDGTYRFAYDPALASDAQARSLSAELQKTTGLTLDAAYVRLNLLPSTDLRSLTLQRQKALHAFWSDYLFRTSSTSRGMSLTWLE